MIRWNDVGGDVVCVVCPEAVAAPAATTATVLGRNVIFQCQGEPDTFALWKCRL